jgi:hypothetical protein
MIDGTIPATWDEGHKQQKNKGQRKKNIESCQVCWWSAASAALALCRTYGLCQKKLRWVRARVKLRVHACRSSMTNAAALTKSARAISPVIATANPTQAAR